LRQLAKNAAPAPKKVAFVSAANRHSVDQSLARRSAARPLSGPAGLPSYMHTVVPPRSAPGCEFHMIQPVELYQW